MIFLRNPEPTKSSYCLPPKRCLPQNVPECTVKRVSERNGTMSYMNFLPRETTILVTIIKGQQFNVFGMCSKAIKSKEKHLFKTIY